MFDVKNKIKELEEVWDEFYNIEEQIDVDDYEDVLKKCHTFNRIIETGFNCEIEFGGATKVLLSYPIEDVKKAIQEVKDYYHRG